MTKKSMLKPMWTKADTKRLFKKLPERADWIILQIYRRYGEEFVKIARLKGQYQDHTGNLRSSIGYIIVKDGNIVDRDFKKSDKEGTDKQTGINTAQALAFALAKEYSKGYVLIGVAGMKYAVKVEAMGKDVATLTASQIEGMIRREAKSLFDRLKDK